MPEHPAVCLARVRFTQVSQPTSSITSHPLHHHQRLMILLTDPNVVRLLVGGIVHCLLQPGSEGGEPGALSS